MKALELSAPGQPLVLVERPRPKPGYGEVLVKVSAAGICHSDVHYRNGTARLRSLPLIPGHEIAGVVEAVGEGVTSPQIGSAVCVHYLRSCGRCHYCRLGQEQFCAEGAMIGKDASGGFAEYVSVPARNLFPAPHGVPLAQAAVLMCSSATAFHAIRKAGLGPGETVAVFGAGGLGMSAIQIARSFAAKRVFAVDIDRRKLELAESFGAEAIDASKLDPVREIRGMTAGRGVDAALELIGLPSTMQQAVASLAVQGRAALAGIGGRPFEIETYQQLIGKEAVVVGVSDHLASELPALIALTESGKLRLEALVTASVPLEAAAVNGVLDNLERFSSPVRTVIEP